MKKFVFVIASMACLYALGIGVYRPWRHVRVRHHRAHVNRQHQQHHAPMKRPRPAPPLVPVKYHHSPVFNHWYHHSFWGPYGSYFWPGFVGGLVIGNAFKPVATTPVVVQQPVVIGPVATNSVITTQQPIIIR